MAYKDDIIEKAKDLRSKHAGQQFNERFVTETSLRTIAERFTKHRRTNVESIKSIKRVIQYMIAAKMVGDRRLFKELNEYSGEVLDSFCDNIEIVDDCGDGFDRAVDRHVYRANSDLYEYLKSNKIYFVDAGIVTTGGKDIFLPQFNSRLCVIGNRRCLEEVVDFVKRTPEKDKHNDEEFSWTMKSIKDFVVYDGVLHVTDPESDSVDIDESNEVVEMLIDAEVDPDDISISSYETNLSTKKAGAISTYRYSSLNKLRNGTPVVIKDGIVYHDDKENIYRIIGDFTLLALYRYENLRQYSLVFSYPGVKEGKQFIEQINLAHPSDKHEPVDFKSWSYDTTNRDFDKDLVYIARGNTIMVNTAMSYAVFDSNSSRSNGAFDELKSRLDGLR